MDQRSKVRFGVLGVAGHFIRRVAAGGRDAAVFEWRGIASRDRRKAEDAARRFGIGRVFDDYASLLASPEIDAVYIPLPNHLHRDWIRRAADAGKAVLCEKPLCLNAVEAAEAIAHAGKKGVLLMEAFMYRFHPQWKHARDLVRCGEIGNIHSIYTHFSYTNDDPENIRNIKAAGGGGLLDIGCYAVSVSRFILGREPERVSARIDYDPGSGTDILASGLLDYNGARAGFTVGTRSFPFQRVTVIGSSGWLEVRVPFNTYADVPAELLVTTGMGQRTVTFPAVDQYRLMCEAFAMAVRDKTPPPVASEDAAANMRVLDALFRAGETGCWENVEPIVSPRAR